ncbi:HyaD/HybD family hydrogenase maturation endopeptidase [Methylococcus capsulatus]|uniref:HyaD/HybD family hydrogenase maturation endopeptidase n=1 Tax=Methylococcus capsulatus TaxID=414 RepID=UPI001C530C89|nr:HyaD/HybD family hydrogenase maturation endopeptidase [Methylococcus capsulatus]QXP93984.1 HyaD/HybD family hydrogenase maturation endopeptidase [Methylococcus capsulatus]UQN11283.1 HyaD/HybD family hydrogenase maturation endopeptidase [Methylococcus capsulatus]
MPPRVLILGIGNLLWADEGFGVRVAQALQRDYVFPENVTVMDGGTQGLALIPYVQESDVLIIADAVDFGLAPASLVEARDEDVPAYLHSGKTSLHQVSFQEVLALCKLMGQGPERIHLVGVQPVDMEDYGGSLTPPVKAQLEPAIARILAVCAELGLAGWRRPKGNCTADALDMTQYERQRPSAEEACRIGDARFLPGDPR